MGKEIEINEKKSAISLGLLFGLIHFAWVLLVVTTSGGVSEWSMTLHHMRTQMAYPGLDVANLVIGTIFATVTGAVIGWLFATIWNRIDD